ncbi:Rpr2-domain-containing protein [Melanomma pulvis-pyrius CBS 109.77]|uniref:Rpr2-domain-containing protein n=1 Tax=Melanomma pulvis-pyrius CBS 109.77 TaxID=1314802 RepID=A0A6A6WW72_9PLEO|nr:Rpr2-domain-containing protein [Melanomma pulvis-pyrius CBS 109.77]
MAKDGPTNGAEIKPQKALKKPKTPKAKGVPNKHLHARTTFLYQAATYLTLQAASRTPKDEDVSTESAAAHFPRDEKPNIYGHSALALQLGTHLRAVSLKGQVRLSSGLKRTMCKTCNAILIPGQTSAQMVENESKGGKKACADVLVVECNFCGSKKRFPVGAARQQKKAKRGLNTGDTSSQKISVDIDYSTTPAIQTGTDQSPSSG